MPAATGADARGRLSGAASAPSPPAALHFLRAAFRASARVAAVDSPPAASAGEAEDDEGEPSAPPPPLSLPSVASMVALR